MSGQTSTKTQSEISILLARSFFYRLLADFLKHPASDGVYGRIQEIVGSWEQALSILRIEGKETLGCLLGRVIRQINEIELTEWVKEYERCFGHTAHSRVPAYELEYGEEHSHRQPQQMADIAAFYSAFGLRVAEKIHERVDHAAVECEFVSFLIYKEAYALEHDGEEKALVCRDALHHFLSEHLGQWLPAFAHRLSRHAERGLMKDIADFAFTFAAEDAKSLGLKIGSVDMSVRPIEEGVETGCISCLTKTGSMAPRAAEYGNV